MTAMRILVELSAADVDKLGFTPFRVATEVHSLVRARCRYLGAPGVTAVEYEDGDEVKREEVSEPGILRGPFKIGVVER